LLTSPNAGSSAGIQVSGAEDVDVLRWNGTCVTVRRSELVTYVPGQPKNAPIIWKYLGNDLQQSLLTKRSIEDARRVQRKQCRSSSARNMTKPCEKATSALGAVITVELRQGLTLAEPSKLPQWVDPSP
jgi:hypothetical protein